MRTLLEKTKNRLQEAGIDSPYEKAKELGCNKVAFAHHADDAIETLLMNIIHGGRMATFDPKMYLTNSEITSVDAGGSFSSVLTADKNYELESVLVKSNGIEVEDAYSIDDNTISLTNISGDIVVEVMGGVHPAYEYVKAALEAGKNVVTSNSVLPDEAKRDLMIAET